MKMTLRDRLLKPEYLYRLMRPGRFSRVMVIGAARTTLVHLPWRLDIVVDPRETLGKTLVRFGVYDLAVSEALWRLIEPGSCLVDVGANIGYMTSIMAMRAGKSGRTIALEPHPKLSDALLRNVDLWTRNPNGVEISAIEVWRHAASDRDGEAHLRMPPADFPSNEGLAFIVDSPIPSDIPVKCIRLDSAIAIETTIDLLKVDVEGHELAVFRGAEAMLSRREIRHIVFEEHANFPTSVTSFLERFGYMIYQIGVGIFGPVLGSGAAINSTPRRSWEPRSLLATLEPSTVTRAFAQRGWRVLRPH